VTSGQPPLMETSDPAELLGVARDASLRDLKQAYARLIKIYRPEHAPQEFQRIHAAFEDLRHQMAGGYAHLPPREFRGEGHVELATLRAEANARKAVQEPAAPARAPDPAELHANAFVSRLQAGASVEELSSVWENGLEQDLDLVAAMFELSPPAVLAHMADAGHFGWSHLAPRRFPCRGALWTLHARSRLAQGCCEELLAEAQDEGFREAAEEDAHLREALWLPLTVAAWDHPTSEFEPFAWAMDGQELSAGAKTFHQACQLREHLKRVAGWRWLPPGFSDLIRLGRVSPALRHELLLSSQPSLDSLPQSWWRLCEKLSNEQELLGYYLLGTLAMNDLTGEAPLGALPRQQRELLAQSVKDAQTEPSSLRYSLTSTAVALGLLLGSVLVCVLLYRAFQAVFAAGTAGALLPPLEWLLAIVVLLIVLGVVQSGIQDRYACRVLRSDLARSGVGYQQLVDSLDQTSKLKLNGINYAALKLYLTLNLAVQRSVWAQARSASYASGHTS
jgi:hypothetical protein